MNPEELTLFDPACGSGHILVEAYDLLKVIYQERGYRAKDIPRLILEKNLYGLEIDDRAAQLAAFALIMKARADDRRIISAGVELHLMAIQESKGLNTNGITEALNGTSEGREKKGQNGTVSDKDVSVLVKLFEHGKTFGSLLHVSEVLRKSLPVIAKRIDLVVGHGGMFEQAEAKSLIPAVKQARILLGQYDAVVTNPPYMGSSNMNPLLKRFAQQQYPNAKSDTFAMFVLRCRTFTKPYGHSGFVTPFVWMFLSSYEQCRNAVFGGSSITSLIQLEYNAFEPACVPVCTFTLLNHSLPDLLGTFVRLSDFKGHATQAPRTLQAIRDANCSWRFSASVNDLRSIPGSPVAYWLSKNWRKIFAEGMLLSERFTTRLGMSTANNDRFLRMWWEVSIDNIKFDSKNRKEALGSGRRWFPYQKGGVFRKWYGNNEFIVDWLDDGHEIRRFGADSGRIRSHNYNLDYMFREGGTWSDLTSATNAFRYMQSGFLFDGRGSAGFGITKQDNRLALGLLNSNVSVNIIKVLNPTIALNVGEVSRVPLSSRALERIEPIAEVVDECIAIAKQDWDSSEVSWDYESCPLIKLGTMITTVSDAFITWSESGRRAFERMRELENHNNREFVNAYGLEGELSTEVAEDTITLYRPDRKEDIQRLISYAIGCMMGRYSLDQPGLIYARSGNVDFDDSKYGTFPADDDGIVPMTDFSWFEDDATNRFEKFITTAWDKEHREENMTFVANALGSKRGGGSRETIRRYLATGFFKHHLQMYKKRPIYWLFSSGKQHAFQCLVYLHRYNEGTLARMRTEYVIPLQGKIAARVEQLDGDISAATSTSHRKKLEKERDTLVKQRSELQEYDEKLRHYADQQISLDLDDGVKVNYGKFSDLLAEVKVVTGKKAD